MAKVRIKNISAALNSVRSVFADSVKSEQFLTEVKDFVVLRIQAETRKGRDLKNERPQPELSDATVSFREKINSGKIVLSYPQDGSFFRPSKSNLTMTGQLMESIDGRVVKQGMVYKKNVIEIFVSGARRKVRYLWAKNGKEIKFGDQKQILDNAELAKDLAKRGREFLGLDIKGIELIRKKAVDIIRRAIRNRFTKSKKGV